MKIRSAVFYRLLAVVFVSNFVHAQDASPWEKEIAAFEAQDKQRPPPQGGIVFVGSSSIRFWKLEESFPNLPVINRGFGGSCLSDSVKFADRIVVPYQPRLVVLYAGDNDVESKSAEQIALDFQAFVKKIHDALPPVRILYISTKPSFKRWRLVDKIKKANELIQASMKKDDFLQYVDIFTPMLGEDGKPRKELLQADGLHLTAEGYKLWNSILLPLLK